MNEDTRVADSQETPRRSANDYCAAILHAEKAFDSYHKVCDDVDKHLSDLERLSSSGDREMQVLWANFEVMKPAVYAKAPIPVVTERFKSRQSMLYRECAEVLQRCATTSLEMGDINSVLELVRDDVIAASRGAARVRYIAKGETDDDFVEGVAFEHYDREDFLHEPARKWSEVGWVAFRHWLTRAEIRKRFKDVLLKDLSFEQREDLSDEEKVAVYEVWDKTEDRVVWVNINYDEFLDEDDPPLKLDGFFPCPKPAYGMVQRRSLIPVPDFCYIRDQLTEINDLTAKVASMTESLKLRGFYPGGQVDVKEAVESAMASVDDRAILIPIAGFTGFGSSSLQQSIVFLPLDQVIQAIEACLNIRRQLIDDVYQVSGISDVQRGDSDPNETLGAQQLKSQWGSRRTQGKQQEIVRFARDLIAIAAEILAEEFSVETIMLLSQTDMPRREDINQQLMQMQQQLQGAMQDQQMQQQAMQNPQAAQQQLQQMQQQMQQLQETTTIDDVVELLDDERLRPFILDVESDSTIQPDEVAEKQSRNEFMQVLSGYLEKAVMAVKEVPELGPVAAEGLKFVTAAYRQGRQVQDEIDQLADKIRDGQIKPPQQDNGAEAEKAKVELEKQRFELDQQRAQMDMQTKQTEQQMSQAKFEQEQQGRQMEMQHKQEMAQLESMARQEESAREQQRFAHETKKFEQDLAMMSAKLKLTEAQAKAAKQRPASNA